MASIDKTTEVSLDEILALTNRSKILAQRAREGYFKSERHGVYKLGNVNRRTLKYSQGAASGRADGGIGGSQSARTDQIRQRMAIEARDLISFKEHTAIVETCISVAQASKHGLPARSLVIELACQVRAEGQRTTQLALSAKVGEAGHDPDGDEPADDEGDDE